MNSAVFSEPGARMQRNFQDGDDGARETDKSYQMTGGT
jgi:hypothetical protein